MIKMKIVFLRIGSFSGINKSLLKELNKYYEVIDINVHDAIDPRKFKIKSIYNFLINFFNTFFIYGKDWKLYYTTTPFAFKAMTKYAENKLKEIDYDLILQTQTLFAPSFAKLDKPFYIYLDYTHKCSKEIYKNFTENRNKKHYEKWVSLEQDLLEKATKIFTYNETIKKCLVKEHKIDSKKIKVAGVGVHFDDLPNIKKDYDKDLMLAVTNPGSFRLQGIQVAIDAFKILKEKIKNLKLIIVGYVFNEKFPDIEEYSFMEHSKLIDYYDKSLLFLIPGIMGGVQAVLEAMSRKCICIVGEDNVILHEIVQDEKTGFIIKTNNANDLVKKIQYVISLDSNKIKKISENSYEHIKKNYTWEMVVKKIFS